ncbi:hypothetical protein [Magnetospirillum sp. UT-4]|uniref:hypothetical protein n=1 Tax=Magnetospirillum sp. UT-4 TaxID=2681467 RepID=UPI00137CEE90|nr:hypothetical protein [Magnetospirillum sp. UT-4]CAA7624429.1 conserved hypothetical protein [Magnetospirillum sp. UT-4]
MFGFLKDMFDRQAQEAIDRRAARLAPARAVAAAKSASPPEGARQAAIERGNAQIKEFATPERQALLKNAMAVHRAQRQILDALDDESRAKLVAMAITTLMRGGSGGGGRT